MQKGSIFIAAVFISIAAATIFFIPATRLNNKSDKMLITVTTSIIADAVKQIANETIHVHTLMGPGVDPHSYHARLSDLRALLQADIILYNGLHLEGKMANMLKKIASKKTVFAVANCLNKSRLIQSDEFDGIYDPHIWFDIPLWIEIIKHITEILITYNKTYAKEYEQNKHNYIAQLNELHQSIQKRIKQIPKNRRYLVTTHDAFSYFGRLYNIHVISLQGINLDAEPCIIDMQQLVHTIIRNNINTIFVESSLPHKSMQAICQAVHAHGWHVNIGDELYSDALGTQNSSANSYINMINHNVNAVVNGINSR